MGTQPPPKKRGTTPNFWPMSVMAKRSPISATAEHLYRYVALNDDRVCMKDFKENWNVAQCPTWWPPCRTYVAPSVQCRWISLKTTTTVPRSNAAKMRNHWNLLGCHKLANRSQPLMDWSSPYCGDMWGRYCRLTSCFLPLLIVNMCLSCEDMAR